MFTEVMMKTKHGIIFHKTLDLYEVFGGGESPELLSVLFKFPDS